MERFLWQWADQYLAQFRPEKDTRGYFLLMERVIRSCIPLAIYGDRRHGMFKFSGKPRHITRPVGPSQFTQAMRELGIEQIFARSPQAKGRVECMAGTFQDRLVSELRLAGAATFDQANVLLRGFLPRFNAQFRVPAQQDQDAYRPFDSSLHLERFPCFKHPRQVDRTTPSSTNYAPCSCFSPRDWPSYAGAKVEVLERSDGKLMIQYEGEETPHQEAPLKAGALRAAHGGMAHTPERVLVVRKLSQHGLTRKQL